MKVLKVSKFDYITMLIAHKKNGDIHAKFDTACLVTSLKRSVFARLNDESKVKMKLEPVRLLAIGRLPCEYLFLNLALMIGASILGFAFISRPKSAFSISMNIGIEHI